MTIRKDILELFTGINDETTIEAKKLVDNLTIGSRYPGARETTDPLDRGEDEITVYSRINHTTGETIYGLKKSN